ncbi:MAG: acyl-CoA dehydrogenase family protein [Acidobacteria bacterium]|nr:acyl-CoA dehydrogenase family protein [Acidobacteriota bacterium]
MDFALTEQQQQWRHKARDFATQEVAPIVREMDEKGFIPPALILRMGELGFTGGPLPKEYGGCGMDYVSMALVYEEIGRVCSSVRGFLAVHVGLHAMCIRDWGTAEQKRRWLPELAGARHRGCYALTEPNAGSDVANMETTCRREGEYYVINGMKQWISNAMEADAAIVFATSDRALRHKGINAFVVDTNTPGFRREKMTDRQLGHNASDHARIYLDNVRIHESQRLGAEGDGFKVAMGALDHGRLGVAAGAVGVGQACLDASLEFARNRVQFGQPIGQFQMIQQVLAEMATEIEAARLLVYRAAAQKDSGKRNTTETSMAKFFATEAATRAANEAVLLHGSYGYSNSSPVERYLRDIKGYQIYEGTNHIQRIIIARAMLKGEVPQW